MIKTLRITVLLSLFAAFLIPPACNPCGDPGRYYLDADTLYSYFTYYHHMSGDTLILEKEPEPEFSLTFEGKYEYVQREMGWQLGQSAYALSCADPRLLGLRTQPDSLNITASMELGGVTPGESVNHLIEWLYEDPVTRKTSWEGLDLLHEKMRNGNLFPEEIYYSNAYLRFRFKNTPEHSEAGLLRFKVILHNGSLLNTESSWIRFK